jgi:hypothetical protein
MSVQAPCSRKWLGELFVDLRKPTDYNFVEQWGNHPNPLTLTQNLVFMKQYLFLVLLLAATGWQTGCKNAGETADNADNGTATEQSAGNADGGAIISGDEPRQNVSEQFTGQFGRMGIDLSPEQLQQVEAIAAKYNFSAAPDRESRKAMRQEFQKEVFDVVLTPEQQAKSKEQREEIKANRPDQQ